MLAWFCARSYIWGERQLMSKTAAEAAVSTECGLRMARLNGRTRQEAAEAAVSTECGFANGAAERVKEAFGWREESTKREGYG